mgnify:CR=1 FL=1
MKHITLSVLLLSVCSLTFVSCKKEGCTNTAASNYDEKAKKDDGSCKVPTTDSRDQIVGNYLITDSLFVGGSFSEEKVYVLQVTKGDTKKDTIYLNNLWNEGGSVMAINAGSNFSIPNTGGLSGLGKVSGNTLNLKRKQGSSEFVGKGTKY